MQEHLQTLLVGYLANAKHELNDNSVNKLNAGLLQNYLGLIVEAVPITELTDKNLIKHALHCLDGDYSTEETILHIFLLYIFKLSYFGSNHPLERGIIKQKIAGILPIFKNAHQQQLIRTELFERNIDALLHIMENTPEQTEILEALKVEYEKFQD